MADKVEEKKKEPMVPVKWVLALVSASGSAILIAIYIGMWAGKIEAKANEVPDVVKELKQVNQRLATLEGIAKMYLEGKPRKNATRSD